MPYTLSFAAGGTLVLGLLDGRLFTSSDRGDAWRAVEHDGDVPRAAALAVA
jgi:hypothetical protein